MSAIYIFLMPIGFGTKKFNKILLRLGGPISSKRLNIFLFFPLSLLFYLLFLIILSRVRDLCQELEGHKMDAPCLQLKEITSQSTITDTSGSLHFCNALHFGTFEIVEINEPVDCQQLTWANEVVLGIHKL